MWVRMWVSDLTHTLTYTDFAEKVNNSPEILRFRDYSVMCDQFRCMLKIGKIESWSGFELFQPYFLLTISRDREDTRDF